MVDVTIERSDARRHRAIAARDDGTSIMLWMHDYGEALPHDLVHWVVETELDLTWGFWGLLAAGAQLEVLQRSGARSPRSIDPAQDPLVDEHRDELLLVEALVAGFSDHLDERPVPIRLHEQLATIDAVDRMPSSDAVARVTAHLDELWKVWHALKPGARMRLQWDGAEDADAHD
jgi:hypothetical protein